MFGSIMAISSFIGASDLVFKGLLSIPSVGTNPEKVYEEVPWRKTALRPLLEG